MTNVWIILIDLFLILFLTSKYKKDFMQGLLYSLAILIILPQSMGININETFPVVTTHRVIIFLAIYYWWKLGVGKNQVIPFYKLFIWIILFNGISLLYAPYFTPALKRNLSFIIENFLFYIIIVTSFKENEDIKKALHFIYISISFLAIITLFERYTNFKILDILPVFYNFSPPGKVIATLPHPILLGVMLAIGLVLSGYYFSEEANAGKKLLNFINIFFIGASLYFTVSRGPWIAAIIANFFMFFFGNIKIKITILIMISLTIIVFIVKPGVYDTVEAYYQMTTGKDNLEGASFYYRLELWDKAYREISRSPLRMAIGYGLEYHRNADLYGEFELIEGRRSYFISWDNEFAVLLLEGGFIGLTFYVILYFGMLLKIFLKVFSAKNKNRGLLLAIACCVLINVFMMTNVKLFSYQVLFVFHSLVALGLNLKLPSRDNLDNSSNSGYP